MKIKLDNKEIVLLSEVEKMIIQNDILSESFQEDMERRLVWSVRHKLERSFERLKKEWEPKLKDRGIQMVPTNEEKFAELVFSQPDYKNRSQREQESR